MGKVHSKRSMDISSTPKKGAVDVPAKVSWIEHPHPNEIN